MVHRICTDIYLFSFPCIFFSFFLVCVCNCIGIKSFLTVHIVCIFYEDFFFLFYIVKFVDIVRSRMLVFVLNITF